MHGYFRAPMRITKVPRAEGSTKANEGSSNYRTPFLVDDDYYRSGFAYTPVNETDFAELYLSVGNEKVTATIQFQGSLYSDAAKTDISRQPGISQGWLTYRTDLDFIPYFKTRLRVKGGAFWERYGHLPKYDTYIFARTHQMGENVRLEFEKDDLTFWLQHGIGTHLEDISANQGLTLLNYASIGASYAHAVELGGYIFDSQARDKRALSQLTDASMGIVGVDLRADTRVAGRLYGATSYISADQATFMAPAIEVMHSYGGRGITENYLGTQSSENGTGSLWNVGFQYDLSVADLYRGWTGKGSPLPWNGDVNASLFGVYTFVQSKQASPDPLVNRDDRKAVQVGRRRRLPDHRVDERVTPLRPRRARRRRQREQLPHRLAASRVLHELPHARDALHPVLAVPLQRAHPATHGAAEPRDDAGRSRPEDPSADDVLSRWGSAPHFVSPPRGATCPA